MACTVEAWPRANLVWLFQNKPLHDSEKYSTVGERKIFFIKKKLFFKGAISIRTLPFCSHSKN